MRVNKENVLFIAAGKGFFRDGVVGEGYKFYPSYTDRSILTRLLREISFCFPFLPSNRWFNKTIRKENPSAILVFDPLITEEYLCWLKQTFPKAQLNFVYRNLIGKAKHLLPDQIPSDWRIWTYDDRDAKQYGLRLYHVNAYFKTFLKAKEKPEYDVLFVGKDKGRGDYLLQLKGKMEAMGLRTMFLIASDGRFSRRKHYHQKQIPYRELVDLIVRSRSILNVALEGQEGMTIRDLESMFFGVKLLTTNKNAVTFDMYYPQNVFILNERCLEDLPRFLETPMVNVPDEVKEKHTLEHFIEVITEAK